MKKLQLLLIAAICFGLKIQAQTSSIQVPVSSGVPQAYPYSSIVRSADGNVLSNQFINLRISMRSGSVNGPIAYQETDTVTTSPMGIFSVVVGGGKIVAGNFDSIPWSSGQIYQQVEMDDKGGNTFADMGTAQLLSLPYALSAGNGITDIKYDSTGKMSVTTTDGRTAIKTTAASWMTTGNSGAAGGFIGTTDNTDLVLKRNNTESLKIKADGVTMAGKLGIGLGTPATSLDLSGGLTLRDTTVNVSGAFNLNVGNHALIFINSSVSSASAILGPGLAKGQVVVLAITGSSSNNGVRFYNNGSTYNTRVNISGGGVGDNNSGYSYITYKEGNTLTLLWNGTDWVQMASSMANN